jgi:hypothetical protein
MEIDWWLILYLFSAFLLGFWLGGHAVIWFLTRCSVNKMTGWDL